MGCRSYSRSQSSELKVLGSGFRAESPTGENHNGRDMDSLMKATVIVMIVM